MNARQIFQAAYGHNSKNFMTPQVCELKSLVRGVAAYELSAGTGFDRDIIYGVSVAVKTGDDAAERAHGPISGCFRSLLTARDHIEWLKDNWTDDLDTLRLRIKARGW